MPRKSSPRKTSSVPLRARSRGASSAIDSDPIKHVVVLCLENRPFDQMLGGFMRVYPKLEGIDPTHPGQNAVAPGEVYRQERMTYRMTFPDPKHDHEAVVAQLQDNNGGFVRNYAENYSDTTPEQRKQIMGYYGLGSLPALHELARHFVICDQWFSSVPGPTWPNRLFLLSGTSQGRVKMFEGLGQLNLHSYDQDTIFDRLNAKRISWRVYHGDFPLTLLFANQRTWKNRQGLRDLDYFEGDAAGSEAEFPAFTFIEPDYIGPEASDDHPPHDVLKGEWLIALVYNALRNNRALWETTLLVILFDEHGGFYDHVVPTPHGTVPPDDHAEEYDFTQLGLRVPALLVSPWVDPGVVNTLFDHTSLLRYLADKWGFEPLGQRAAIANSFASAIRATGDARTDTPEHLTVTMPPGTPTSARVRTENEEAIILLTQELSQHVVGEPGRIVRRVANAMANSPRVRDDVRRILRAYVASAEQ